MTTPNEVAGLIEAAVSREDAIKFLESACRNWDHVGPLSHDDIDDVAGSLASFLKKRLSPTEATEPLVERVARAIGLNRFKNHKPPVRWPTDPKDTLSGRDGTVPLTWDFAEACREDARAALSASISNAEAEGRQP